MSIGPSQTSTETSPPTATHSTPESFALRYAKRSFEPFDTRPTPTMFADKWTADSASR